MLDAFCRQSERTCQRARRHIPRGHGLGDAPHMAREGAGLYLRRPSRASGQLPLPTSLSRDAGPLSVIQAFARPEVGRCMNGGPLTLELHDSVFKREDGSVAQREGSWAGISCNLTRSTLTSCATHRHTPRTTPTSSCAYGAGAGGGSIIRSSRTSYSV